MIPSHGADSTRHVGKTPGGVSDTSTLRSETARGPRVLSPVQAAEDGGHAHDHVGHRQGVGGIFPCKLFDLLSGGVISQEQLVGALEES